MKKRLSYLMMTAILLTVFARCGNDDEGVTGGPVEKGEPTGFSLTITQPTTYADAVDPNATNAEVELKTVDVFIFRSGGEFEKRASLTISDFDKTANKNEYVVKQKITTTVGAKEIYVGVNLPGTVATKVATEGINVVYSLPNVSEITTNGFAMFSRTAQTATLVKDDSQNTVKATVARLVAKVSVTEKTGLSKDVTGGKITNLQFAASNVNKKYFILPKADDKDPNYEKATTNKTDFYKAIAGDYKTVNAATATIDNESKLYVTENTSDGIWESHSTYASVRGQFLPANVVKLKTAGTATGTDADGDVIAETASATAKTFYTVSVNGKRYYFYDNTDATAFATAYTAAKVTYTDGWCYYNVFLNPAGNYNVLRNKYYKVTVSAIHGIGEGEDGSDDDDINVPTKISITVDIENWTPVSQESELG